MADERRFSAGAPRPDDEAERLETLRSFQLLDTSPDPMFDHITSLASQLFATPIALISLVDETRQWFKSACGLGASETPREQAFCAYAILSDEVFIVPNALEDERFAENPLVLGPPDIRFYAGAPLIADNQQRIGTLCIIDTVPRSLSAKEIESLKRLAAIAMDTAATHRNDQLYRSQLHDHVGALERTQARLDQAVDHLEASNMELRQYASVVSHDLQAPLRHVAGFVGLLEEHCADQLDDDARGWIDNTQSAVRKMRHLIRDLLGYAKVESRRIELEAVDLNAVAREAMTYLSDSYVIGEDCVTFGELPRVTGNARQLVQVFENLIGNGLKYRTDARVPRVTVEAEVVDGFCEVSVADNGIGIPEDKLDSVFEIFQRLHTDQEFPGTGIGLAICKRVLERHGGDIRVESRLGQGSTFSLRLPLAEATEAPDSGALKKTG